MAPSNSPESKIMSLDALERVLDAAKERGERVVQCHGCFDIVHPGHIRHLRFAAAQGERLLVSITADAFVNKGPGRPMFSHDLRAENLAALEFVDWVVVHHEPTAEGLLSKTRPEVYIKGAEYADNGDARFAREREIVEASGGRVVFSSGEVVFSSTSIVESIRTNPRAEADGLRLAQLAQQHDLTTVMIERCRALSRGKRVAVVGETIVDIYQHCRAPEMASEHPMLSLRPAQTTRFDGGAAVIAGHLRAMGLRPLLCTPVSDDEPGHAFAERMREQGIDLHPLPAGEGLPEKTRYIVGRDKVMKIESPARIELDAESSWMLASRLRSEDPIDAVILADFGLGLFGDVLAERVIEATRGRVGLIVGDVSGARNQLLAMKGADVLCPCENELRHAMNDFERPLSSVAMEAIERTGASVVCVTMGAAGLVVFTRDRGVFEVPALSHNPVDTLGCGDAMLSAMTVGMLGGANLVQSSYLGSLAAAVAGGRLGNLAVGADDVREFARGLAAEHLHRASNGESQARARASGF